MANEGGDMKLLGNYRKLIDLLTGAPAYAPPNSNLTITALEARYTAAMAAVENVSTKMGPNKVAITAQKLAFDELPDKVTRPVNVLKASGASKEIVADLDTSKRKVLGRRKSVKIKDDPNTPENEASASNSASQMSYANQIGNFRAFLAVLDEISEYQPNDAGLKLPALATFADALQTKLDAVSATFVPLSQARGDRDGLLYLNDDSVVDTALQAKAYVAGELGKDSPLYKQIAGIEFRRRRD